MYSDEKAYYTVHYKKHRTCRLLELTEAVLIKRLVFGNCSVKARTNTQILNANIGYKIYLTAITRYT